MYIYAKHSLFDFSRELFISYPIQALNLNKYVLLHTVQVNGTPYLHMCFSSKGTLCPQDLRTVNG